MNNLLFALIVNSVVFLLWLVMFVKNKEKGLQALKVGSQTILGMLPLILIIIGGIGLFTTSLSPENITKYLGERAGISGFIFVSLFSSLMQIPGIIAFPIAATLLKSGAAISVVAVFAGASTMASVFTFPIEIRYLGKKFAVIRILLTYVVCVIVGILTGIIFHLFK